MENKRKIFNVGILGAGNIAESMAKAISGCRDEVHGLAIASRDIKKAEAFAKKWGFEKAYGSYQELVSDPDIDLIYVATPHSHHYEHAKLCIENGKPALVEKAFTANYKQAKELIELSESKKIFIGEAMWTRFMPARHIIESLIDSGIIGEIQTIDGEFSIPLTHINRLCNPHLAGGALLDLGVYSLTFASMYLGDEIERVETSCEKYLTGVDGTDDIVYIYKDGKTAHLKSSFTTISKNEGTISGTKGKIWVETLNNYSAIKVYDLDGRLLTEREIPPQINGYEYELLASKKAILEGKMKCEEMSHKQTLEIMRQMDYLRKCWDVTYPFE